jgi:hypothetical protein
MNHTIDLLTLIARDTPLKRTSAKHGGEYSGPCPLCRQGTDRFKVWPQLGRWACLGPKAGRSGCDKSGDAIDYLRHRDNLPYPAACAHLGIPLNAKAQRGKDAKNNVSPLSPPSAPFASPRLCVKSSSPPPFAPFAPLRLCVESISPSPPNATWRSRAATLSAHSVAALWSDAGARPRAYLHARGLFDGVLRAMNVGYNPCAAWEDPAQWGLEPPESGQARPIWLPRGITFPWYIAGEVWRLNIRRPLTAWEIARGEAKYIGPRGFANALYNAGSLKAGKPAVLVEGELDALTVLQACGSEVAVVATGFTTGARRAAWAARLALASVVLVAFDADPLTHPTPAGSYPAPAGSHPVPAGSLLDAEPGAGDKAAAWWLHVLPNALRWRPLLHDVNTAPDVEDVRSWVRRGLDRAQQQLPPNG